MKTLALIYMGQARDDAVARAEEYLRCCSKHVKGGQLNDTAIEYFADQEKEAKEAIEKMRSLNLSSLF